METYCTRPGCPRPTNHFSDLDDSSTLKTVQQKFCTTCGMPQILIGRYLPIKLLGQGGFGAAFLAIDRYTPAMRKCVVKQFLPSGDLNPDQMKLAQELFEREGEVLENLGNRHPQIPDLLAFFELSVPDRTSGQDKQFFYLVQQFIDGQDLEEEMNQRGAFSEAETLEVLLSVLQILKFVHENNSIHRDIKPSNIMRDRSGKLYLLDFGAVKQVTAGAGGSAGKSSTGIYSMGFAPPEQMAGNAVYPATDLYALGVTCITLLTGKQPNELHDPYSNSWNWRAYAQVKDWVEAILNRMLLPTPSQRFQSADEVIEAMKQALSGGSSSTAQPVAPPPPAPVSSGTAPVTSPPAGVPAPAQPQPPIAQPQTAAPVQKAQSVPIAQQQLPRQASPSISLMGLLGGAAFTGFEGGLLAIAITSLVGTTLIGGGFWIGLTIALVLMQLNRVIERWDLVIIAVITLVLVLLISPLHGILGAMTVTDPRIAVIITAALCGLVAVFVALLFRLIYTILSSFL